MQIKIAVNLYIFLKIKINNVVIYGPEFILRGINSSSQVLNDTVEACENSKILQKNHFFIKLKRYYGEAATQKEKSLLRPRRQRSKYIGTHLLSVLEEYEMRFFPPYQPKSGELNTKRQIQAQS